MAHTTTKWGFIVPDETDTDDVPSWLDQLADQLDVTITGFKADTLANRPSGAGIIDGLLFWDTTNGAFYLGHGGTWHALQSTPGVVGNLTTIGWGDAPALGDPAQGWAPIGHRHGNQANPITAHLASGDPHTQYALDTDFVPRDLAASEQRALRIMTPGATGPSLRRTGAVNVTSTNLAAMTAILPAVAAGRKAVIKSIVLTNTSAVDSYVSLAGDSNNASQFVAAIPVAGKSTIAIDCALVLDAGKGLFAASAGAGTTPINATVAYCDIAAAELPTLYSWTTGLQGGGAVVDVVAPGVPVVLSSMMIGNTSAVDQSVWIGIFGSGHFSELVVPANGLAIIDTPLYFTAGGKLQAQNVTAGGNWVSITTSGYPAQS